jgi:catechol 2,3-dioxygenase-like lactoylglutathione lyase family enzyme
MPVINVQDMAYVRYSAPDLEKMRTFLIDFGMAEAAYADGRLFMRGAGPSPFIHATEQGEPALLAVGFKAASVADLQTLAAAEGVAVEDLDAPGGGKVVRLRDPDGFPIEVVAGQQTVENRVNGVRQPWNHAEAIGRTREAKRIAAGPATVKRLGHVGIIVSDVPRSWAWYSERFGFIGSDVVRTLTHDVCAVFARCNLGSNPADHHTINLAAVPDVPAKFHHAAYEVGDMDDLMAGHDILKTRGYSHSYGIGRHVLGSQVFDYWFDPFGNRVEHWTDGDLFSIEDGTMEVDVPTMMSTQWGPPAPPTFL